MDSQNILQNTFLKNFQIYNKGMILCLDMIMPQQPPESEQGNKEYKRHLQHDNEAYNKTIKFKNKRATQMKYRLVQGRGKAVYMIGVEDNGNCWGISQNKLLKSLDTLKTIASYINASICSIRMYRGLKVNSYIATVRISMPLAEIESQSLLD
jgi:GTPase